MMKTLSETTETQSLRALGGKPRTEPSTGQFRATIAQDSGSQDRNLYRAVNNCSNVTGACVMTFPTVPAGKRLIIDHVRAAAVMSESDNMFHVVLRGGSTFQFLPIVTARGNFIGRFDHTVDQPVFAIYETGQAPNVDVLVATSEPFTVEAFVSGYTIDIP
jgi:hypothetical protein